MRNTNEGSDKVSGVTVVIILLLLIALVAMTIALVKSESGGSVSAWADEGNQKKCN